MTHYVWMLIILAMIIYGFGDYFSKIYSDAGSNWIAALAITLYTIVSFIWLVALKEHNSLSALGTVWSVLYAIVTVIVAIAIFQEPLTVSQIVGICMGIVSIYFLS